MERLRRSLPGALLGKIECSEEEDVVSTARELSEYALQDDVFTELIDPAVSPCAKDSQSAMDAKASGNKAYGNREFELASRHYTTALRLMPCETNSANDLAIMYVNRAASLHKLHLSVEAARDCTRAISLKESYAKAWYRRALIKTELRDYKGAMEDMGTALLHETSVSGKKEVAQELHRVRMIAATKDLSPALDNSSESNETVSASLHETELFWSPDKQWGLRTTSEVQPGQLVHAEDAAAAILLKKHRNTHCHFCFDPLPRDSVPCKRCATPLYCSDACRDKASVEHGLECGGTAWAAALPADGVLASRMFNIDEHVDLCHHYDKLPAGTKVELHLLAVTLAKCFTHHGSERNLGDLTAKLIIMITKVRYNAMGIVHVRTANDSKKTISSIEHVTVGQAVFVAGSKFNHACRPNVFASFAKRGLRVHATSTVPAASPLELSYGGQVGESTTAERRDWLEEHYFFTCECDSCRLGTVPDMLHLSYRCPVPPCDGIVLDRSDAFPMEITTQNREVKDFLLKYCKMSLEPLQPLQPGCCLKCHTSIDVKDASVKGRECLERIESLELSLALSDERQDSGEMIKNALIEANKASRFFYPFNKQTSRMEDVLARLYCEAGEHSLAVGHSLKSIKILELTYGQDNIAVAYERVKLASIAGAAGVADLAESCMGMANKVFCIHYGADYKTVFPSLKELMTRC